MTLTPSLVTTTIKAHEGDLDAAATTLGIDRAHLITRLEEIARDRAILKRIQAGDVDTTATPEDEARDRRIAAATEQVNGIVSTLSPMERVFLINYLAGESQVKAAEIAGYKWPEKQGSRIANTPKMRAAIDEVLTRQEMGKLEVIARLSEQARAGYAPYLLPNGTVDLNRLIGDGKAHLIKGYKQGQWGLTVEFHDAQTALVNVARYHGLLGARGNEADPIHQVGMTLDEWRAEVAKRRADAAATEAMYSDDAQD